MVYNKQQWKDEIPDLTKPIKDSSGKQKTDPQTGRPLYELVQEGTRLTSQRLNHIEDGIETVHELADQNAADIDTHKKDTVKHITAAERAEWKAKETPAGAQTKADAALSAAKTYADTALLAKADKSSTYSKTETDQRIQTVVGAAPDALDTLKEIGDALNNDPNFAATVTNQLSGKVDKVSGKQLSTEDYSSAEKAKLAGLTPGAGAAGSATDATIGNRTADPSITTPYSLTGSITQWFSWITKYFKTITGKANPFDAPDITLAATKTHVDDTTRHITAAERTAWNAAETNAKNASIPLVQKGAASGVPAMDAAKYMLGDGISLKEFSTEAVSTFSFTHNVANQKVDLITTGSLAGFFEVTITGTFGNQNNVGRMTKRFNIMTNTSGTINSQLTQYTEVTGPIVNCVSISDVSWDATSSQWRITIEARTSNGNGYAVHTKRLTSQSALNTKPFTLGTPYTGTAATTLPVAVQTIPDDTVTQSGYLIQKHRLTQNDGSTILFSSGSMDTLFTAGFYYVTTSVTGRPPEVTGGGLCDVYKLVGGTSSTGAYQRITDFLNLRTFIRYCHNSVWSAWVEIENANRKNVANGYAGIGNDGFIFDAVISGSIARKARGISANQSLSDTGVFVEGEYYCATDVTAATLSGMPPEVAGKSFHLKVVPNTAGGFNQTLTAYGANVAALRVFTRNYYNSVWSNWYEIEHSGKKNTANGYAGLDALIKLPRVNTYNSLGGPSTVPTADLNLALTAGVYPISPATLNKPSASMWGQVMVIVSGGETHVDASMWTWQIILQSSGDSYVRRKDATNAWSAWVPLWTGYNDAPLFTTRGNVSNNTDYNTLVKNGVYMIYNPTGTTNSSPVAYGILTVSATNPSDLSSSYIKQEVIEVTTGTIYSRSKYTPTSWTPWVSNITGAGGTMTAALVRNYDGTFYSYRNLVGYNATGTATGTIKITMPKTWSNTMMSIKIKGYDYTTGKGAWELILGGYNYSTTPAWANISAVLNGRVPFDRVRLAHDGTNNCILLGSLTTVWGITHIEVSEFTAAFGAITGWEKGWQMGLITSETGIFNAVTPALTPQYGKASATNYFVTTTSEFAFLARTPAESGNFEARVYLRLTAASSVKVTATYKDHTSVVQSTVIVDDVFPIGSYSLPVAFFAATSDSPISLLIKCSAANVVYASGSIIDC
ncbi:pyocin knob domain-containing protein [Paenibacillus etheri]|uniref:Tail fiber protein n=1 Tax=Paenibacillus etheri TaxID=1306852 RepID=A0A0W1B3N7_9BACL|nr:pyocin knob domain-containing protein [Paenibacillus etheri]KTD88190.1 hypothetical protein UQ64_06785 [Paenibacillus etheri]